VTEVARWQSGIADKPWDLGVLGRNNYVCNFVTGP
jgi:hypothetical protein